MKRKLLVLLTAFCVLIAGTLTAYAAPVRLIDEADLLSSEQESQIAEKLNGISRQYQLDVVILTVESLDGATAEAYADDYYDENGYGPDGILLLVSTEEGDWWVSTAGYGITAITDAGLEYMADRFVPQLSDGEYAQAFETFADLCDSFLAQAKTGDPYDSHNLPKEPFSVVANLLIALVIGLVAALIVTGSMKSKLNTVRKKSKADDYVVGGSMRLTASRDLFLYTKVEKRERPKESSGSSTHTSSSGNTHGGGGGKF